MVAVEPFTELTFMDTKQGKAFHTLDSVARTLGVPHGWLREQVGAGIVPCIQAGGRRLFDLDSVREAIIESQRQETASAK